MKKYVVGFGDNVVDYYLNSNRKFPGGNSVNFAVNAKKCGIDSYYVGCISNDRDGTLIKNSLLSEKVNISYCNFIDSPTEQSHAAIECGDRKFVGGIRGSRETPDLSDNLINLFKGSSLVHSSCHSGTELKIKKLKNLGVRVSFDFSDVEKYRTRDYLSKVCPYIYIAQFSVAKNDDLEINRLISDCATFGVPYILFTRGSLTPIFVDTIKNQIYEGFVKKIDSIRDTMGAGDAYFAAFASYFVTLEFETIEEQVAECFKRAANIAYCTLQIDGSFGHSEKIK